MPVYEFIAMEGPPHAPVFFYRVKDGETALGSGQRRQQTQMRSRPPRGMH